MKRAALAVAAVLAASACDKAPESRQMSEKEVAAELANVQIRPGLWESRSEVTEVTAPNLPSEVRNRMKGRSNSSRHCITPEQAARPDANFLASRQENCSYRDFSMRAGRMQGNMVCTGGDMPGEARAVMSGQYGPESYDMRMRMELAGPADATMTIETRASGRRVGECPAEGDTKQ